MTPEPVHPMEERLRALARVRRGDARELPPLSERARLRLQDEVTRLRQSSSAIPEPAARAANPGHSWRWIWAWGGVGVAGIVLVWVVMFSYPPAPSNLSLAKGEAPEPKPEPVLAPALDLELPDGASDSAGASAGAAAVATNASPPATPDFALAQEAVAPASAEARGGRFDFNAAQQVRHAYRVASEATQPPILARFELVQTGAGLEIHDRDGSVFAGRLPRRVPSQELHPVWAFEARGYSRTLGKEVRLTGNFDATPVESSAATETADNDAVGLPMPAYFRQALSATVLVQGASVFEVRATPERPSAIDP